MTTRLRTERDTAIRIAQGAMLKLETETAELRRLLAEQADMVAWWKGRYEDLFGGEA